MLVSTKNKKRQAISPQLRKPGAEAQEWRLPKVPIFFHFQGVAQTYPTENEPRVKLMKASRPFGASLLKQLG